MSHAKTLERLAERLLRKAEVVRLRADVETLRQSVLTATEGWQDAEARIDAALPHIEAVLADAGTHTIPADPTRHYSGHGFAWDELHKAVKILRGEK